MKSVISDSVDHSLWALNRMFQGLEAIIENGGEHFVVGMMRTVDGKGNHQWSELKAGLNMFQLPARYNAGQVRVREKSHRFADRCPRRVLRHDG